jgi:tyrosyl-tRNA synthetase
MHGLIAELGQRGMIHEQTPGLGTRLSRGPITGYVGFDPTADSLHVGNLVPVMALAWLQRVGGHPLIVVGGGTGMVGDPSGKRAERPVLSVEQVDANAAAIRGQLGRFLDFDGPRAARLLNNANWLRPIGLLDFLRETGKHFTIGYMLQKEAVKSRLDSGISFTEFAYMLVQAYDFDHLFETEHCELQMGGTDQWGNITAGIELVARKRGAEVHGLTVPLLVTATGSKFGKSEAGNVWLDPAKTSPYAFYQFWINSDDRDVERLLKIFTFRPVKAIAELMAAHAKAPEQRAAQRELADELTRRIHGDEALRKAQEAAAALFGRGDGEADGAPAAEALLTAEMPEVTISAAEFGNGMPWADVLVRVGLATSKADARRGLEGRGFYVGNQQLGDPMGRLEPKLLTPAGGGLIAILRKGKKTYVRLVVK